VEKYPWYEIVAGTEELLQGDFISACPVVVPPPVVARGQVAADVVEYDVVIMSQSCDLAQRKLSLVLVCPVWPISEFERRNDFFKSRKGKEALRQGSVPGYHLLNRCSLSRFETDFLVVDFRSVYSVSFDFLVDWAPRAGNRCRLLSPYKEHLSQAFARFFMRVGLPLDIPPFQ